jgi:hypothetical protein
MQQRHKHEIPDEKIMLLPRVRKKLCLALLSPSESTNDISVLPPYQVYIAFLASLSLRFFSQKLKIIRNYMVVQGLRFKEKP